MVTNKQNKQLSSIKQINSLLLQVVNSVYLDGADTIIGISKLDAIGNIVFRFRDGKEVYDGSITPSNRLSYVEAQLRGDSYLEGMYLSEIIPVPMPKYYTQGILDTQINLDTKKRRRCQQGKPCGDTCIEKGDVCDRSLGVQAARVVEAIRNALVSREAMGLGAALLVGGAITTASRKSEVGSRKLESEQTPPSARDAGSGLTTYDLRLTTSSSSRSNPSQIEVITVRTAAPQDVSIFRDSQERIRRTNQVAAIGEQGVITTDPRARNRAARGLPVVGEPSVTPVNWTDEPAPITQKIQGGGLTSSLKINGFDEGATSRLQNVISRIDKILDLPELPPISLEPMPANSPIIDRASGIYLFSNFIDKDSGELIDRVPTRIQINASRSFSTTPELTTIHEVGHLLDHAAIGNTRDWFATSPLSELKGNVSPSLPVFNKFFAAVERSQSYKNIAKQADKAKTQQVRDHHDYMLRRREIWARAFTQYVVSKSGSSVLKAQLKADMAVEKNKYWSDKEFKQIESEMDSIFKELKWR